MASGALDLADDPALVRAGRGHVLGSLGVLRTLGLENLGVVVQWRVKSDKAAVARIPLKHVAADPEGGTAADLATLYEVLCSEIAC